MHGIFQMQGGKNWILPKEMGLSLAGNPVKPLLSLYGTEWRERCYGLSSLKSALQGSDQRENRGVYSNINTPTASPFSLVTIFKMAGCK